MKYGTTYNLKASFSHRNLDLIATQFGLNCNVKVPKSHSLQMPTKSVSKSIHFTYDL